MYEQLFIRLANGRARLKRNTTTKNGAESTKHVALGKMDLIFVGIACQTDRRPGPRIYVNLRPQNRNGQQLKNLGGIPAKQNIPPFPPL